MLLSQICLRVDLLFEVAHGIFRADRGKGFDIALVLLVLIVKKIDLSTADFLFFAILLGCKPVILFELFLRLVEFNALLIFSLR